MACLDLDRYCLMNGAPAVCLLNADTSPTLSGRERGSVHALFDGHVVYYNSCDAELNYRPYSALSVDELVQISEWIAVNPKKVLTVPRADEIKDILEDVKLSGF